MKVQHRTDYIVTAPAELDRDSLLKLIQELKDLHKIMNGRLDKVQVHQCVIDHDLNFVLRDEV